MSQDCQKRALETLEEVKKIHCLSVKCPADLYEISDVAKRYTDLNLLFWVGRGYALGLFGLEQDQAKAFSYFHRGALREHVDSMVAAAICLRTGRGCDQDLLAKEILESSVRSRLGSNELPNVLSSDYRPYVGDVAQDEIIDKGNGLITSDLLDAIHDYDNSYLMYSLAWAYKDLSESDNYSDEQRQGFHSSMEFWLVQSSLLLNHDAFYVMACEMEKSDPVMGAEGKKMARELKRFNIETNMHYRKQHFEGFGAWADGIFGESKNDNVKNIITDMKEECSQIVKECEDFSESEQEVMVRAGIRALEGCLDSGIEKRIIDIA